MTKDQETYAMQSSRSPAPFKDAKQGARAKMADRESGDIDIEWIDLTDPAARRKRQNRLHQRLWRAKRKAEKVNSTSNAELSNAWNGHGMLVLMDQARPTDYEFQSRMETSPTSTAPVSELPDGQRPTKPLLIQPLIPYLTSSTLSRPLPPIIFPISPDHHLLTLVQYNVLRGMVFNMVLLSLLDQIPTECHGVFSLPSLSISPPSTLPPSLQPSALQKVTPHDPSLNIIPFPALRDNLILNKGKFDEDDLCCDLVGGLYEGFNEVEIRGVMVWGEPWSPEGWEASEGFVRKWGFLLKGCTDLMEATNRWRRGRGESVLVVEV